MSAFASFWVGCLVGAVTGVMAMALAVVARDAEEREERFRERKDKEDGKEELYR